MPTPGTGSSRPTRTSSRIPTRSTRARSSRSPRSDPRSRTMNNTIRFLALALVAVGLVACKKDPPPAPAPAPAPAPKTAPAPAPAPAGVTVSSATLGSAVGSDKKVSAPKESFAKNDTIYVSVDTSGTGTANLKVNWTYTGKDGKTVPVKEDSQTIQASGASTTEFHISKPDGWPAGDYTVEVSQDGRVVQTKRFKVQ